jgi:hypothetical protein
MTYQHESQSPERLFSGPSGSGSVLSVDLIRSGRSDRRPVFGDQSLARFVLVHLKEVVLKTKQKLFINKSESHVYFTLKEFKLK